MSELTEKFSSPNQPSAVEKPEEIDTAALTRSAGRGMLWQLLSAGCQTVIQLGASAVLARVLFPEDYGMMGMAMLAQGFIGRIGTLGSTAGLIAKKDVTQDDLSTAFWTGMLVYGPLFLIAMAGAPLAAMFFRTPAVASVWRAISVSFLFVALGCVPAALLTKRLQFGALKVIEVSGGALGSASAILFAVVFGLGYWSLVLASLLSGLGIMVATVLYTRWVPSLRFSRASFRYLFRYGANEFGTNIVGYFHYNVDYLLVGRLLGPSLLGLYEFAYRIPHMLFDRLAIPLGGVLFPTLSQVQTDDDRLAGGYVKTAKYIGFVVFPALGGLAAVARPAVVVLWGEKWLSIVVPLQVLCATAALRCVLHGAGMIFLCKNRPDLPFKFGLAQLAVTFAAVGTLGYLFGLSGVALGMFISVLPGFGVAWYALRMTHNSVWRLLRALGAPTIATLGCLLPACGVRMGAEALEWADWAVLAAAIPAGAAGYFGVLLIGLPSQAREVLATVRLTLTRSAPARPLQPTPEPEPPAVQG